ASAGPLSDAHPSGTTAGSAIAPATSSAQRRRYLNFLPGPRTLGTRRSSRGVGFRLGLTPTGLADGLALDDRALPADHRGIRPSTTWVPRSPELAAPAIRHVH